MQHTPSALTDLPIVGDFAAYERDRLNFLVENQKRYGDIIRYDADTYIVAGANPIDYILTRTHRDFISPENINGAMDIDYQDEKMAHIIAAWRTNRAGLVAAFHPGSVQAYLPALIARVDQHLAGLRKGRTIRFYEEMKQLISSISVDYFFGCDGLPLAHAFDTFLDARFNHNNSPLLLPDWIPTPNHITTHRLAKSLTSRLQQLIQQRRTTASERKDVLSALITTARQNDTLLSDERICAILFMSLFQSRFPTIAAVCWVWWLLTQHPEQQEKLSQEIEQGLRNQPLNGETLSQLRYLDCVTKEALRLYPPIWQLIRDVSAPTCELNGMQCHRGQRLQVASYVVQRDAHVFPAPESFLPERWLAEEYVKSIPKGNYIPFGSGPKKCLGMNFALLEIKVITIALARRFRVRAIDPNRVRIRPDIVLRPEHLNVTIEPITRR